MRSSQTVAKMNTLLLVGFLCLLLPLYVESVSGVGKECQSYKDCPDILWCELSRKQCVIRNYEDCSEHRNMCRKESRCDATGICSRRNGSRCTSGSIYDCPAGAACTKVPGSRYRNYCICTPGVSTEENSTCKPLDGKVYGSCKKDNSCDDAYAVCNSETARCECGPGTSADRETLSCRLKAGQNCAGDKKKLCELGTICGDDKICKVMGGRSCAGERKDLCEKGYICVDEYDHCYADVGTTITRNNVFCRPGAQKDYDGFCWIAIGEDCKDNKELCYSRIERPSVPGVCDPPTNTCKVRLNSSWCTEDKVCPAGAQCVNRKCQCVYSGQSFARHQDRVCGLPRGKVGAQCRVDNDTISCVDVGAECKDDGYCACKPGYVENTNLATCELGGPKCTFHGQGMIKTFFGSNMDIVIPCRFKMADFRCGKVKVEILANKQQSLVEEVTVNLKKGKSKYSYTQTAKNILEAKPWEMKCLSDACEADDQINLSVDATEAVLEWQLLRIAYNRTSVHVECGHKKLTGRDSYPNVLCGSPTDTSDVLKVYKAAMKVEGGQKPEGFTWSWMWERAFYTARMTDRAVLIMQDVPQSNPQCKEASRILSGSCPGIVENMYNCSHLIDDAVFDKSWYDLVSYTDCLGTSIEPMQAYASCLEVMCNRNGNATSLSDNTCRTLRKAAKLCEDRVGRRQDGSPSWTDPYMTLTHLLDRLAPQCKKSD